jgi:hypothetical protein
MCWQKVNFSNLACFSFFSKLINMAQQIAKQQVQNKNEQEISKNIQYSDVYRKMVSQMAKNSEECF